MSSGWSVSVAAVGSSHQQGANCSNSEQTGDGRKRVVQDGSHVILERPSD
jgi:hypothetical protein